VRSRCLVHVARLGQLEDHHARLLEESERTRLEQYRFEGDRQRFILGAVLARSGAAEALQADAASITLDRTCPDCGTPHGKPSAVAGGPQISVSHSGDVVLVAVTQAAPVGVDVEVIDAPAALALA
jgi:4'-phosphopantetheinyl transferase